MSAILTNDNGLKYIDEGRFREILNEYNKRFGEFKRYFDQRTRKTYK